MNEDLLPECIIDSHTHLPREPGRDPGALLDELSRWGVKAAVILGIPSMKSVVESLDLDEIRMEYGRAEQVIRRYASALSRYFTPEYLYYVSIELSRHYGLLCEHKPYTKHYRILAAVDLNMSRDGLYKRLEELYNKGFRGFKIISTLFLKHLDHENVDATLEFAESKGLPVVIHAGCDPGIWELPGYCKYGDPSRLRPLLRRHRDAIVVIAHIGGYSAIAPGVFTSEAIELSRIHDNIYYDTSAVPSYIIRLAAEKLGPERLLYGSDYPVVTGLEIKHHLQMVANALKEAGYTRRDLEKVFAENASKIFHFNICNS